jgi:hypothetical protein
LPCKSRCASFGLWGIIGPHGPPLFGRGGIGSSRATYAWAENPFKSTTGPDLPELEEVRGIDAGFYTYLGSGTFYTSGYSNDYATIALFGRPNVRPGHALQAGAARPHHPRGGADGAGHATGRRFQPYDPWLLVGG